MQDLQLSQNFPHFPRPTATKCRSQFTGNKGGLEYKWKVKVSLSADHNPRKTFSLRENCLSQVSINRAVTCTCDLCFVPASCFPIFSDESDTCIFHSHLFTRRKSFPGEISDHMKKDRDAPFVQLRGINYWFWAHLKCTGHNSFFCTFFSLSEFQTSSCKFSLL